jgi:hypothetical protein
LVINGDGMSVESTGLSERPPAAKARKCVSHVSDLEALMTLVQVRAFFGNISTMSIWRWRQDPGLGFPMPVIVGRKPFWVRGEILAFRDRHRRFAELMRPEAST